LANYFNAKTKSTDPISTYIGEVAFGILSLMIILMIIGAICAIVFLIYDCDYKSWSKSQEKYIAELKDGKEDVEAIHIPVRINLYQRFSYKILPLNSLPRYITWSLVRLAIATITVMLHIYVSLLILPWKDEKVPWPAKWIISICIQVFIGLIVAMIYMCIEPSCTADWQRFKSQRSSAQSHKD